MPVDLKDRRYRSRTDCSEAALLANDGAPVPSDADLRGPVSRPRLAYTIAELSALTSISRSVLYAHVKQGALKITKVGRRTIVLQKQVDEWLRQLQSDQHKPD